MTSCLFWISDVLCGSGEFTKKKREKKREPSSRELYAVKLSMAAEVEDGNLKLRVEIRSGWGIGGLYPFVVACFDNNLKRELYKTRAVVGGQLAVWNETFTIDLAKEDTDPGRTRSKSTSSRDTRGQLRRASAGDRDLVRGVEEEEAEEDGGDENNGRGRTSRKRGGRKSKGRKKVGLIRGKPVYLTFFLYDTGKKGIPSLGSAGVLLRTVRKCGMAMGNFPIVHGLGSLYVSVMVIGGAGYVARRRSCVYHGGASQGATVGLTRSPSVDNVPSLMMHATRGGAEAFDKGNDEATTREPSVSELSPDDDEQHDDHHHQNGGVPLVSAIGGERNNQHGAKDPDSDGGRADGEFGVGGMSREFGALESNVNSFNGHGLNDNDDGGGDVGGIDGDGDDDDTGIDNDIRSPIHMVERSLPDTPTPPNPNLHPSLNHNISPNLNLNFDLHPNLNLSNLSLRHLLHRLRIDHNQSADDDLDVDHGDDLDDHHDSSGRSIQPMAITGVASRDASSRRSASPQYDDDAAAAFFARLRLFPNYRDEQRLFNLSQSLPHSEHEYSPDETDHDFDNLLRDVDGLLKQYYDF